MIDKTSVKMLKYIKKHANVTLDELSAEFGDYAKDAVDFLRTDKQIIDDVQRCYPTANGAIPIRSGKYRISPKGLAYLRETRAERRRYWIPIILSNLMALAALIISISK